MRIIGPNLQQPTEFEAVLRSLPGWFGIENALLEYVEDTTRWPTFAIEIEGRIVGFLTLREHFPASWEIHCMAIAMDFRGRHLGTQLLEHCEKWLTERGVKFLQVKTVAATSSSAEYEQTRKFYDASGFTPLEIFPDLWDPWNPALQCIKVLNAA